MNAQLLLFKKNPTYKQLKKSVRQAMKALDVARKRHRGQAKAAKDLQHCRTAQIKYEVRHGLVSTPKARQRDKAA